MAATKPPVRFNNSRLVYGAQELCAGGPQKEDADASMGLRALPRRRQDALVATDAELLQRIVQGDLSLLGVIYDRHQQSIRQFVSRATAGSADTDDLTHETFLTLAQLAERFDGRASAGPILIGIATRLLRSRRRENARRARMHDSFGTMVTAEELPTPEELASDHQQRQRIDRAIARLSAAKRTVYQMVEQEGLSGEEVSKMLKIPVGTVGTRLHHARTALRKALNRERRR